MLDMDLSRRILLVICSCWSFLTLQKQLGTASVEIQTSQYTVGELSSSQEYVSNMNVSLFGEANAIDSCWRPDPEWASHRTWLSGCALGFGSEALGGASGPIYVVTDPTDDFIDPRPGTLRFAVNQPTPLWITFERNMLIVLGRELVMTSYKTIDGRGADVHIAYGPCITVENVNNVIIHGLTIHHCTRGHAGKVRVYNRLTERGPADGDGIRVLGSRHVWIDHNSLSSCADGLIDVTLASSFVTISNNLFTDHDKVMLMGHNDSYVLDLSMKVTVAFNRFGPGCVQRMPRCRFGYFHVLNNDYVGWEMYAIGGSAAPVIRSEGNRYEAIWPKAKEVTKREQTKLGLLQDWSKWEWTSVNDWFLNGAYFVESGGHNQAVGMPPYIGVRALMAVPVAMVPSLTHDAGRLLCLPNLPC